LPLVTTPLAAWLVVLASGTLEIVFAIAMKFSDGYSKPLPSVVSIAAGVASVWLMSTTLKVLPLGTAYAVWAGIGTAGTALVGIVAFGEPATAARLACMAAIVAGIVGLQLQGAA
jgi:quaternary ammonium compound-resistance protein SugE